MIVSRFPQMFERLLFLVALPAVAAFVALRALAQALVLPVWWLRNAAMRRGGRPWIVVCLSHVPWNHIWQRNHHTMTQLARERPVVYLQHSGFSYVHSFARALAWSAVRRGELRKLLIPRDTRGVRVRQVLLLPGESRLALVAQVNAQLLALHVAFEHARAGGGRYALWFYYPAGVRILRYLRPASIVYDIQDQYTAFAWAPRDIGQREEQLLRAAKVVFPGTYALHESRAHANKHFFPCGVEFDHFNQAATPGARERFPLPEPLRPFPPPAARFFYAGLIDARLDREILRQMAERHPDWQIVMVGPVDTKLFDKAGLPANVLFPGAQPYADLPRWIAWSDVLLMPWAVNDLTKHINPTKTLEYLAARRPVVATAIPDLRRFYADTCLLAESPAEFTALCERALGPPDDERLGRGLDKARQFAWTHVVGEMRRLVEETM